MVSEVTAGESSAISGWVNHLLNLFGSFVLSAIAAIALIANIIVETFNPARLGAVLVVLLVLHLFRYPRFFFSREIGLYASFAGYMLISLLWTNDIELATNTLLPTIDCVLVMLLVGALATFHDLRAVLAGLLSGFLVCAGYYDLTRGFPFVRPDEFSYNAVAGMFLFGLVITLTFGWVARMRILPLVLAPILMLHIAATTSVKTNLGVLLGAIAACVFYFAHFIALMRRNAIPLVIVAGLIVYAGASNEGIIDTVQAGIDRVTLGANVLIAREDRTGVTEFGARKGWEESGIAGWAENPVFGHGVEAFRDDFGMTSHSTPIDVLYNAGLIGIALFYGIFASIALRLYQTRASRLGNLRALLLAVLVCYAFISLSGTMHYSTYLAVFIAICSALLVPEQARNLRTAISAEAAAS
jgi:hypothetical protein